MSKAWYKNFIFVLITLLFLNLLERFVPVNCESTPGCGKIEESIARIDARAAVPWAAAIFYQSTRCDFRSGVFGNGVIIGPTTIIISGNFLWSSSNKEYLTMFGFKPNYFMVAVGLKSKSFPIQTDRYTQFLKVASIQPHYKSYEAYSEFDYALIHLKTPIQFSSYVRPICVETLPQAIFTDLNSTFLDAPLTLSGFTSGTNELRRSSFEMKNCTAKLNQFSQLAHITTRLIATQTPCGVTLTQQEFENLQLNKSSDKIDTEHVNQNFNSEDSAGSFILTNACYQKGSALTRKYKNQWYLLGIVTESIGYNCNSNMYFVSIVTYRSHLQWILNSIKYSPLSYICFNGQQVNLRNDVCNNNKDCEDGSDENDKYCDAITCRRYSQYCNHCHESDTFKIHTRTYNFSLAISEETRCQPIEEPEGANVYCEDAETKQKIICSDGATVGTKAVFRCKNYNFYNPILTSYCVITCQSNGKWSEGLSRLHCQNVTTTTAVEHPEGEINTESEFVTDRLNFTAWLEQISKQTGNKSDLVKEMSASTVKINDHEFAATNQHIQISIDTTERNNVPTSTLNSITDHRSTNLSIPSTTLPTGKCPGFPKKTGVTVTCRDPFSVTSSNCSLGAIPGTKAEFDCSLYYKPLLSATSLVKTCQQNGKWTFENRNFECRLAKFQHIRNQRTRFSQKMVMSFQKPDCGIPKSTLVGHIVNGVISDGANWPWHGIMFVKSSKGNFTYICGSTLISRRILITAAHCVTTHGGKPMQTENYKIILGALSSDLEENIDDPNSQILEISNITVNPAFNFKTFEADIAVIQLSTPAEITDYVRPACFPTGTSQHNELLHTSPSSSGYIVGFGYDETGQASKILKEAYLPVVSYSECYRVLKIQPSSTMFCAGYTNGTAVCNGDSGGGMLFEDEIYPNRLYIQGIVSHGNTDKLSRLCDYNQYSVFTKVGSFKNWVFELGLELDEDF